MRCLKIMFQLKCLTFIDFLNNVAIANIKFGASNFMLMRNLAHCLSNEMKKIHLFDMANFEYECSQCKLKQPFLYVLYDD